MPAKLLLAGAIIFEALGIVMMKEAHGLTVWWAVVLMLVFFGVSFLCFTFCLRKMDVAVTYAIWSASGAVLIFLIGLFFYKEVITIPIAICLALIVLGVLILGSK